MARSQQKKLSKTQKKRQEQETRQQINNLNVNSIGPKTINQNKAFKEYDKGQHLFLHGCPGTGKTFIALGMALKEVNENEDLDKLIIIRSTVPTRDMGFLPGSVEEKSQMYELPYMSICKEIYGRSDAYSIMKNKGVIEFCPTSFVRGLTFDNAFVVIDEVQNMSDMEIHSVLTRLGNNTKLIICGDTNQDDLTNPRYKEESGIGKCIKTLSQMSCISMIYFTSKDIVRSGFVKEYIEKREGINIVNIVSSDEEEDNRERLDYFLKESSHIQTSDTGITTI